MESKELKIYDIITQWLTHYEFNFSQLGKVRNEEEINKLNVAKKEVKDLEKFTRLVIERRINITVLDISINSEDYNHNSVIYDKGYEFYLLEEEFNFAKEMVKKYER